MATVDLIEYEAASPEVRRIYDDIMTTREVDWINNFWKVIAVQPELLQRTWRGVKEVMAPGVIDALTKEMIYVAVSVTNGCEYCIHSHTAAARKKGMTDEMYSDPLSFIVGQPIGAVCLDRTIEPDEPTDANERVPLRPNNSLRVAHSAGVACPRA